MADLQAKAILSAEDRASAVLAMVARNFDRLNKAADAMHTRDSRVKQADAFNATLERRAAAMQLLGKAYSLADRGVGMIPGMYASGGLAIAPLLAAAAWAKASKATAEYERAYTRIGVTGESTKAQQDQAALDVQRLAAQTAMSEKDIRSGLEALVASGRSIPEAMSFLPTVTKVAQATGGAVSDIGKSANAASQHLKITAGEMNNAFDIMAAGGKAGMFELKDMARYMPSFMPAGALAGFKGTEGLQKMVAMLQTIREGSGTAEEAASSFSNILAKFESDKTIKELGEKFEEVGMKSDFVEKRFEKARAAGENLVEVFLELIKKATKGDYSKIGKIIDDMEFKRGTVALLTMEEKFRSLEGKLKSVAGTVDQDFNRVLKDSQSNFDRLSASASRAWINIGKTAPVQGALKALNNAVESLNNAMEKSDEMARKIRERESRPIQESKTAATQQAEGLIALAKMDPMADANIVDRGFHFRRPKDTRTEAQMAADTIAARDRYHAQVAAAEREAMNSARIAGNVRDAEEIQKNVGAVAEALRDAQILNSEDRKVGATYRSLEEQRRNAEREMIRAGGDQVSKIKPLAVGADKFERPDPGGVRSIMRQALDDGLYDVRIKDAIRQKEDADRRLNGNFTTATPAEIEQRMQREGFGKEVTAKADVSMNGSIKVEVTPSSQLLSAFIRAEKLLLSGANPNSNVTMDGTSQP